MKEICNDQLESIDSDYLDSEGESPTIPEKVYGSPDLQEKIRGVLLKYKDIFRLEIWKGKPAIN